MNAKNIRAPSHSGARAAVVSMADVARVTGVSRSAVSLALQRHPSIPAATRARIEAAAEQLGYRKNPLVAALMKSRRSPTRAAPRQASLAFLTSDLATDQWRDAATQRRFYAAAAARAAERGFSLDEFSLSDPKMRPDRLAGVLRTRGIHGILVAPLLGRQTTIDFDFTDFSVVGLGTSVKEPAIDRVADDHFYGAQLAFEHGLALGYRRIGLAVAASVSRRLEHRWWSGYLVAQQAISPRNRIPALMPETRNEIPSRLNAWIARHRIDAVIFALREQNNMAGAPKQVGLISLSVHDAGTVAGIQQQESRVGTDAIDLIIDKMHRWEAGVSETPRLQLVRGLWRDGLSAPGIGQVRRALLKTIA